jgi:Sec23-binding domain of Sec16
MFSLMGADSTFPINLNAIRLTEILEYSLITASGKTQASPLPQFQAYKLWYAAYLADIGMISQASAYVSSISAVTKEFPQPCPYIHGIFGLLLKELGDRLEVMYGADLSEPNDSSSGGWLGKISENFTGAALGRGLEHLMNSAVGVPSSKPALDSSVASANDLMHESHMKAESFQKEGYSGDNYLSVNNHIHQQPITPYTPGNSHVPNDIYDSSFAQGFVEQSYVDSSIEYPTQDYPDQSQSYTESSQYYHEQQYGGAPESFGVEYYADQAQNYDQSGGFESGGHSNISTSYQDYSHDPDQRQEPDNREKLNVNHTSNMEEPVLNAKISPTSTIPKAQVAIQEDEDLGFGNSKKPPLPPSNSAETNSTHAKKDDISMKKGRYYFYLRYRKASIERIFWIICFCPRVWGQE